MILMDKFYFTFGHCILASSSSNFSSFSWIYRANVKCCLLIIGQYQNFHWLVFVRRNSKTELSESERSFITLDFYFFLRTVAEDLSFRCIKKAKI